MHPSLIQSDAAFTEIVKRLDGETELCLDCEFHSEGHYYPKLCLVQLAFGTELWAIDPHHVALAALGPVLESKAVRKVLHDGRQDLPILAKASLVPEIHGIFDTQIAAAFAGYGGGVGYAALVLEVCGVQLDKSFQVSDWTRKLSDAQLEYALDDVRYLSKVSAELRTRLGENGRSGWVTEACEQATERALGRPDPEKLYRRVASCSRLNPQQLGILRELAKWRDRIARTIDKPAPSVANDLALKAMALRPPRDLHALESIRGLGVGRVQPWATQVLEAIEYGAIRPEPKPKLLPRELDLKVDGLASLLGLARRFVAIRDGIAQEILCDQAELRALSEWHLGDRPSDVSLDVLGGWRRTVLGELLLGVLSGEVGFHVDARSPSGIGIVRI